jgi:hypothetical protein
MMDPFDRKPFFQRMDPVESYFVGLQKFLQAPVSGTWDPPTHAAFYRWLGGVEKNIDPNTPWGKDPKGVAHYITESLTDTETDQGFALMQDFLRTLGLPAATRSEYRDWLGGLGQQEIAAIEDVLEQAASLASAAERGGGMGQTADANEEVESEKPPPEDAPPVGPKPDEPTPPGEPPPPPPPRNGNGNGPPPNGRPPAQPPAQGMSTTTKVLIGVGAAVVVGTVGYFVWQAMQKKDRGAGEIDVGDFEAVGDSGCGCGA